ncbi:hypothetical protein [Evansella halocellulosilytica]|uniref:hypothetical protein n=1 Tax=Evansella halocellulosilytica TaxID=2011013 RepID=UPI000BB6D8E8|nr:hypothetical protein [Evansella halocellulosilytica]
MDWHSLIERIIGFLPQRSVLLFAFATGFTVLIIQSITNKCERLLELPWMKQENIEQRQQLIEQLDNNNQKGAPPK